MLRQPPRLLFPDNLPATQAEWEQVKRIVQEAIEDLRGRVSTLEQKVAKLEGP
jgi:hypothetical protein